MATSPTSISLEPDLKAYAEDARREGGYSSVSAYVVGLIRQDRRRRNGRRYREIMDAASPEEKAVLDDLVRSGQVVLITGDDMADSRQGEVRAYLDDEGADTGTRVIVVSSDEAGESGYFYAVPIRDGGEDLPPYLVLLGTDDPQRGQADCAKMFRLRERNLGERVGLVGVVTMRRIAEAISDLIGP